MNSLVLCGLLALALGTKVEDKLTIRTEDTPNFLNLGETMFAGDMLRSENQLFCLQLLSSGNLVLSTTEASPKMIWESKTGGHSNAYATMEINGNFVIYDANSTPLFSSGTCDRYVEYLEVSNYGCIQLPDYNDRVLAQYPVPEDEHRRRTC